MKIIKFGPLGLLIVTVLFLSGCGSTRSVSNHSLGGSSDGSGIVEGIVHNNSGTVFGASILLFVRNIIKDPDGSLRQLGFGSFKGVIK